jgi:hypothetical protein
MPNLTLHLPTETGTIEIELGSETEVNALRLYQEALHDFVATGRPRKLRALKQRTVTDRAGTVYSLLTSLTRLRELALVGDLEFDWDWMTE